MHPLLVSICKKLQADCLGGLLVAMPFYCLINSLNCSQRFFAQRNALIHTVFNGTVAKGSLCLSEGMTLCLTLPEEEPVCSRTPPFAKCFDLLSAS